MRTTIRLDDDLLRAAKTRAAVLGITLNELVVGALRTAIAPSRSPRPRPSIPVEHGGILLPGVDLDDNAGLIELIEGPYTALPRLDPLRVAEGPERP
jgi:hypothetical protein